MLDFQQVMHLKLVSEMILHAIPSRNCGACSLLSVDICYKFIQLIMIL